MSDRQSTPRTVARFADGLLAADLPRLDDRQRRRAVDFIGRRIRVLPSVIRFGVLMIGVVVEVVGAVLGHDRVRRLVTGLPLPLVAEYPRLVRSLGYAFIWETWPDTTVDGGRPAETHSEVPHSAPDAGVASERPTSLVSRSGRSR